MKDYVMGFAFDDLSRVVLTRTMNDKLAGLSSRIVLGESAPEAVSRHFQAITEVRIEPDEWVHVGNVYRPDGTVRVLTAKSPKVRYINPLDLSTVALYIPFTVPYNEYEDWISPVVSLCQIEPDPTYGKRPTFVLNY